MSASRKALQFYNEGCAAGGRGARRASLWYSAAYLERAAFHHNFRRANRHILLIKFLIIILFYRIGNGVKKYPSKQYSGEHTDNDGYGESCASTTSRAMAMRAPRTPAMAQVS